MMSLKNTCLLLLAGLLLCACATAPQTTALLGTGLAGAIAGLQHALATGQIEPELGGNLLAALQVVQQAMGSYGATSAAATEALARVGEQLTVLKSDASTTQTAVLTSGGIITAYAARKPVVGIVLAALSALAKSKVDAGPPITPK